MMMVADGVFAMTTHTALLIDPWDGSASRLDVFHLRTSYRKCWSGATAPYSSWPGLSRLIHVVDLRWNRPESSALPATRSALRGQRQPLDMDGPGQARPWRRKSPDGVLDETPCTAL